MGKPFYFTDIGPRPQNPWNPLKTRVIRDLFLLAGAGYFFLVFLRLFFFGGFYGVFLFLFAGILRFGHD